MLKDMALRKFGEKTQADYTRHMERSARFRPLAGDGRSCGCARKFCPGELQLAGAISEGT
jgi:hypothetical protein